MKTSRLYRLMMQKFYDFTVEEHGKSEDLDCFIKEAIKGIGKYNDFHPKLVYEQLSFFFKTYYQNCWIRIVIGRSSSPLIVIYVHEPVVGNIQQVHGALESIAYLTAADEFDFKNDGFWYVARFWWD